jgi:hypothetical protein
LRGHAVRLILIFHSGLTIRAIAKKHYLVAGYQVAAPFGFWDLQLGKGHRNIFQPMAWDNLSPVIYFGTDTLQVTVLVGARVKTATFPIYFNF